jgi:hypothetical protein
MKTFGAYTNHLEALVQVLVSSEATSAAREQIDAALDGQPAHELRRVSDIWQRRTTGAFFTSAKLSEYAVRFFLDTIDQDSIILDPACGAGDLLLACTSRLPTVDDLAATLQLWGRRLTGRDIQSEFVQAAKCRLALAAARRVPHPTSIDRLSHTFPLVQRGCGLSDREAIQAATHIVLNPPYATDEAPATCMWGQGSVTAAAVFLDACVSQAMPGTQILAILPDVLRSGSRYSKWRNYVKTYAKPLRTRIYGQFDRWTDVDVFVLELRIREPTAKWSCASKRSTKGTERVADRFAVSVGAVVDYRDRHEGHWHPFIRPRHLPGWGIVTESKKRRFAGRTYEPPFVVVRRTSRPGDKHRAVGTIINGNKPFAVENHLLVLSPQSKTLESCMELIDVLRMPETTRWLDRRIRCRHLTVAALSEIPWWKK